LKYKQTTECGGREDSKMAKAEVTYYNQQALFSKTLASDQQSVPTEDSRLNTNTPPSDPPPAATGAPDFIKVEKNLASLGFFTPSHKRISGVKQKVVSLSRDVNGKRLEARATILPSAQFGLPTTADQDTYLAILKLATEMHRKYGKVTNPIGFTSAEILRIQGKSCVSGYHYKELHEQLMRIKTATIVSEGAVYFAGKKVWAKDAFNVINRLVLLGTQMEDGSIADRHYVWFSDWQLENINNNYLLPIDYDAYKRLKSHIAKILVPLLQIWLYASRDHGCFEKRYEEICQFLNIRVYEHLSKIKEKLGPALDELKAQAYLSDWCVEKTSNRAGYKVVLYHGEKFHRDLRRRTMLRNVSQPESNQVVGGSMLDRSSRGVDEGLLRAMMSRGIAEQGARDALLNVEPGQQVMDQLEWGDYLIDRASRGRIHNPPGFYMYLVRSHVSPPEHFETSRKRKLLQEAEAERVRAGMERAGLEIAYLDYRKEAVDHFVATELSQDAYCEAVKTKKAEMRKTYKPAAPLKDEVWTEMAVSRLRSEIGKRIGLMDFESFCKTREAAQLQSGGLALAEKN
jgi:Replication initiator protein A